jgi:hypothetical protein
MPPKESCKNLSPINAERGEKKLYAEPKLVEMGSL